MTYLTYYSLLYSRSSGISYNIAYYRSELYLQIMYAPVRFPYNMQFQLFDRDDDVDKSVEKQKAQYRERESVFDFKELVIECYMYLQIRPKR